MKPNSFQRFPPRKKVEERESNNHIRNVHVPSYFSCINCTNDWSLLYTATLSHHRIHYNGIVAVVGAVSDTIPFFVIAVPCSHY